MGRPARRPLTASILVAIAVVAALAVPSLAAAAERWTPVVAEVVAPPQPVEGADGRQHLPYELLLINRSFNPPAKAVVRKVEVLAGGKVVDALAGKRLAAVMSPFGERKPGTRLARGQAGFVMMDVALPRRAKLPRRLRHRLTVSLEPKPVVEATRYGTAPTRVSKRRAVVISPPLRGDGWIVGNGCCEALTSHRGALLPVDGGLWEGERFAIDFIQVQADGTMVTGPPSELASYPFFGDPVLAAAPGKVVAKVDGLPETPPGALPPSTAARAGGNYIVVAMGEGRYALYAHLQPGSLRVGVGDRVRTGETIALLGSSGNSNAPHLHFQLMDRPVPVASNGIPYRFDRFTVAGTLTNFGELFEGRAARIEPRFAGAHRRQLPLSLQVVGFGG